jgi:uncharacterized protein
MNMLLSITLLSLLSVFLQGCDASKETTPVPPADFQTWLPLTLGERQVEVQIAVSAAEQRRGLMFRDSLGADQGMLFIYRQPQQMSFWMANTRINLDIGFFDRDGVLQEVYTMFAGDTAATQSRSDRLMYALEMNAGWFAQNEVKAGAQLDMDKLADALRRRGVNPRDFGIGVR